MSRTDDEINGLTNEAKAAGKVLTREDFIFASIVTLSNQVERIGDAAEKAIGMWHQQQIIALRSVAALRAGGPDALMADVLSRLADVGEKAAAGDEKGALAAFMDLTGAAAKQHQPEEPPNGDAD